MPTRLPRFFFPLLSVAACIACGAGLRAQEQTHVGFLWHMHQPIYYPGETITQTDAAGHFSFSVNDIHNQRLGPYTGWPKDAIQAGAALPHLGAQVSFSGSLMENLNNLAAAGVNGGQWSNWQTSYQQATQLNTSLGNTRLDLVGFGHHHPLMPLLDERDMRMQIRLHKHAFQQTWGAGVPYSKGIFPAETAFSTRMIPALKAEGLDWAIVDSIHMERAVENYPHVDVSGVFAPNKADQINPAVPEDQWVQLNNVYAPSRVAAPFAYRPHNVQHVDPTTGQVEKIVAVPAARYEGHEDGRGGFGALQYEAVMDQYRHLNTDPARPMFVLLHHDGDNFGGGSDAYYHSNFGDMVNWAQGNAGYDVSTVQDYLDRFPVPASDVVHIEPGSWLGADAGDPEFKKWLGDPDESGWSPDRNSWAVLTAAKNRVYTAHDVQFGGPENFPNMQNVMSGSGAATERAWHYLLQAQASDHWYWDGTEIWDSNVTRGSNLATAQADQVLGGAFTDATPPTVFLPQRESYNPGAAEFGQDAEPSDFEVWTYAYDVSGLNDVTLKYRTDADGLNPLASTQNETYAGGAEVGQWVTLSMNSSDVQQPSNILAPSYRALRYGAMIEGQENVLLDYYVEAVDSHGNIQRSDIQHVWVGDGSTGGSGNGGDRVGLAPATPVAGESVLLTYDPTGGPLNGTSQVYLHYGSNDWSVVNQPDVALTWDAQQGLWLYNLSVDNSANQLDLAFNNGAGTWDNNGGADWHFQVTGGDPDAGFVMDGQLDPDAQLVAGTEGNGLYVAVSGGKLYVATEGAQQGADAFVYLAETPGALTAANWAKAGQVAEWDAFLADEGDNGFAGWFDANGSPPADSGGANGVLEGVIDLTQEFGETPDAIYLAVGRYGTSNGAGLMFTLQTPASINNDGNIDALEFFRLVLAPVPGDYDSNGVVDHGDYLLWRSEYGTVGPSPADGNGDGQVDAADYTYWRDRLGSSSANPISVAPEPAVAAVLLLPLGLATQRLIRKR